MQDSSLITIFFTGLFTGGLSCMAVQGGLLASTLAQREEERLAHEAKKKGSVLPITAFLIAKLVAYTLLGFLLGWLGSFFQLSLTAQVILQLFVVVFMIGTALNILEVHPIFRYFALQPPRFLTRLVRKQSKSKDLFAPLLLGAFTIFIPCGITQAMMALAIASGNPLLGAAIMFSFILGTAPLFFILGYFTTKLADSHHGKLMRITAFAILILAVFNLNNALALAGVKTPFNKKLATHETKQVSKEVTIDIGPFGYQPNNITVKAGTAVTLRLQNKHSYTCASAFTIPELGIQKVVSVGSTENIQFIAPDKPTQIAFMCSMGMYRGVINVL